MTFHCNGYRTWRENEWGTYNSGGLKGSTRGWEATSRGLVGQVRDEALGFWSA